MITGVRTHHTIDPRNIQLLVQTFWKHIWTQHSSENWNCHNPILCNQATRECLQMIPLTKKIMGKMASMVCFLPLQRVPALCLLGQGIREQVTLHNSSKFRFVWKCSHFTKFQTSWKIQIHRYKYINSFMNTCILIQTHKCDIYWGILQCVQKQFKGYLPSSLL